VGLFGNESVDNPVRNHLADVARRAKIEFFCQPGIWPGTTGKRPATTRSWECDDKSFSFLSAAPEAPAVSHWGINE
jgi:hypothetical protein